MSPEEDGVRMFIKYRDDLIRVGYGPSADEVEREVGGDKDGYVGRCAFEISFQGIDVRLRIFSYGVVAPAGCSHAVYDVVFLDQSFS